MKSIIVYGHQGCGKTRDAERIKKAFRMNGIVDNFNFDMTIMSKDVLYLTNDPRAENYKDACEVVAGYPMLMSYEDAMQTVRELEYPTLGDGPKI